MTIELTLIGKPGCHLCEGAREVIDSVVSEFSAASPSSVVTLEEKNILDDPALAARYAEEIPVLLINGKVHGYWRIDDERFKRALFALAHGEGK